QLDLGLAGALADATDGPRVIAADSWASCGQPLVQIDCSFCRFAWARAVAPSSTIASPWTAIASGSLGSSISALLAMRIALPNSRCFSDTRARSTNAQRLRGSTASAASSASSAASNLPAVINASPCFCSVADLGAIWSSGRWPETGADMAKADKLTARTGTSRRINFSPLNRPVLARATKTRDEKPVGAVVARGQEAPGAFRPSGCERRFLDNP